MEPESENYLDNLISYYYDLNVHVLPNSYIEILILKVMALEYTAFGMILGHRGQTPQNGICVFIQEASDSSLASFIL